MITVRRSHLEEFRRVVATEWGDEAALVRAIRGEPDEVSWQAHAGTAWHDILASELRPVGLWAGRHAESGGFKFAWDDVAVADKFVGPGRFEVPGSKVYETPGGPVRVTCTADHLHGLVIQDNKTKFSPVDVDEYAESLQWRFYLSIHNCRVFRYNFWEFKDPDAAKVCALRGVSWVRFWTYPDLEADCRDWAGRFLDWARGCGLEMFLSKGE